MQLDYIANFNEYGENLVRLFDFDKSEAIKFRDLVEDVIVKKKGKLDLSQVDFIEAVNCRLILALFKSDEGILSDDDKTFFCVLTIEAYQKMLELVEPFCQNKTKGYQFLYEVDTPTSFLFSPAGTANLN